MDEKCPQCEEYLNGWKRAAADLANYKKEELRRFEEFAKLANAALILNLLPTLDSFQRSAENSPIKNQLEDILKKAGVEKIEVKVGDAFNPTIHEAVEAVEPAAPAENQSTTFARLYIDEVTENGYNLHGKLLRPAKVKVINS